jgi:predicted DNA-binding protein
VIDLNSAMTPMSISVSLDLEDRVKAAAKECGANVSSFARQALEAYLTVLSEAEETPKQVQTSGPQCKVCGAFTTYKRVNSHGMCMKCEGETNDNR